MRTLTWFVLLALIGFLSCITGTGGEEGVPHDQNTVLGTLLLFEDVWNNGNMETYKVLLDEDTFIFYFAEEDYSWAYDDEITAVTNLFDAVGPENVDVQLDLSEVTEPGEGVDTYKVEGVPYEVHVYVDEEFGGITYIARGDLDMELEKTENGWVITKWWDNASSRLLGCETSWGAIKASF